MVEDSKLVKNLILKPQQFGASKISKCFIFTQLHTQRMEGSALERCTDEKEAVHSLALLQKKNLEKKSGEIQKIWRKPKGLKIVLEIENSCPKHKINSFLAARRKSSIRTLVLRSTLYAAQAQRPVVFSSQQPARVGLSDGLC
jgi:hypothetical protein